MAEESVDYGSLEESIRKTCLKHGLEDVDGEVNGLMQSQQKFLLFNCRLCKEGDSIVRDDGRKTRINVSRSDRIGKDKG